MTFMIAQKVNAGVVLYWVVTTIFGIFQQVLVNRSKTDVVHASSLEPPKTHKHTKALSESSNSKSKDSTSEEKSSKRGIEITVRRPSK